MHFLSMITGSFAMPADENPTVAMMTAAYAHHGIDAVYLNCEVAPESLGAAVNGARAMGWVGFNCSIFVSSGGTRASIFIGLGPSVGHHIRIRHSERSEESKRMGAFPWILRSAQDDRLPEMDA